MAEQGATCEHTGLARPECGCTPCIEALIRKYAPPHIVARLPQ